MERDLNYLRLLAKSFPTVQSASTEIINLEAIMNLPKGTEHFVTDLHGENEAFEHVLRNCSGVIKRKVEDIFGHEMRESEKQDLCTLIYYPEDKLKIVKQKEEDFDEWAKVTLLRMVRVLEGSSTKYTRSKVRKALPKEYSYIIEELLHELRGEQVNKHDYLLSIVESIVSTGRAEHFLVTISYVIQRLVIDSLHVIGDIYDRGPGAHLIMDRLCSYHEFDIQWGNHDVVWMGAAAGSEACMANVLRMCFRYANLATLEDGYGINLLPLATFAMQRYADDPCTCFIPKSNAYEKIEDNQKLLIAQMHKAIAIIQFKLEGALIDRHPEWHMEDRKLLHLIDYSAGTINLGGKTYRLIDTNFPTIDPSDPYRLTDDEQDVVDKLLHSFKASLRLMKHIDCLYTHGSLYLVRNNNLLYHGSVPLLEGGGFDSLEIMGDTYKGKALFDKIDSMARKAFYDDEKSPLHNYGKDLMWYLWCGPVSPPFDKHKMATFERYFIAEKETHTEDKGIYYRLKNDKEICEKILREFGIENVDHAHIINGHIPVKASHGESPIKAGGKLLVIDGGYSKVYQAETGIAGYTLIYNSQSLKLVQHEPFETREHAVNVGMDVISETQVVEFAQHRQLVRDTDKGKELKTQIEDLYQLLAAFRSGQIRSK